LEAERRADREQAEVVAAKQAAERARQAAQVRGVTPSHGLGRGARLPRTSPTYHPLSHTHPHPHPPTLPGQRASLADIRRELDAQTARRKEVRALERAEEAAMAAWLRADAERMQADRKRAESDAAAARVAYRGALEAQMGEAATREAQPDETPFERARNGRLVRELGEPVTVPAGGGGVGGGRRRGSSAGGLL
jgi:hypothetical protein